MPMLRSSLSDSRRKISCSLSSSIFIVIYVFRLYYFLLNEHVSFRYIFQIGIIKLLDNYYIEALSGGSRVNVIPRDFKISFYAI